MQAQTPQGFKGSLCPISHSPSPNVVKAFGPFNVSYNPSTQGYGIDTTAIVLDDHVFLILKGDHAAALDQACQRAGIEGCIDYFVDHINEAHKMSEHLMATGMIKDQFGLVPTTKRVLGQHFDKLRIASKAAMVINQAKNAKSA